MKHTLILIVAVLSFTMSCTSKEDIYADYEVQSNKLHTEKITMKVQSKPINKRMDTLGSIYAMVYKQILKSIDSPTEEEKLQHEVKNRLKPYKELLSSPSKKSTTQKTYTDIFEQIKHSQLSPTAKSSFINFIELLLLMKNREAYKIYQFIEDYEAELMQVSAMDEEDQRVVLSSTTMMKSVISTTSVEKEPTEDDEEVPEEDKDWDLSIGVLSTIINGSLQSDYRAVNDTLIATLTS
ncbi:hypothetical protein MQE36_12490 [Zhouia spongiae]|uniref:Lipoprotein n=1 Tax=Zhouia spongiae TaxID=2202721 RepID=A0ABY3YJX5_9FLAO|nr:hypothetical protein [Zhouia spongiae]UNY97900.1 hypothetical protein MQE36_12490 [Zhouia spongiae]